ncbi:unnamed protein product [Leuciscus chuanchicus]
MAAVCGRRPPLASSADETSSLYFMISMGLEEHTENSRQKQAGEQHEGGVKTVSVKEGESVILHTGVTEIQGYDQILWKIEDNIIAEINKGTKLFLIIDKDNEKFNGRLQMHHQSGSLIISDSENKDSGVYHLNMISSSHTIQRTISVTVNKGKVVIQSVNPQDDFTSAIDQPWNSSRVVRDFSVLRMSFAPTLKTERVQLFEIAAC